MDITVCIGSSCHIKGARSVVQQLQDLISQKELGDQIKLSGAFCMGKCQQGVCIMIDDEFYSVSPENAASFFETEVKQRLNNSLEQR